MALGESLSETFMYTELEFISMSWLLT